MLAAMVAPLGAMAEVSEPWRLRQALAQWLNLSGTHRTRYETLDSQFRAGRNGSDQVLVVRTSVMAEFHRGDFAIAGEWMDSRAALDDAGTPISTGIVNPVDLLQLHLHSQGADLF